ncbi:MAG: hypothetical protein H6702_07540 [Myxococcales bacterium]|nr:hypothetical protein [Myxococcales bacterium]
MAKRPKPPAETDVAGAVAQILADERVLWIGVKHYSPSCARAAAALIREARPAAVLVEGPEDGTPLIEHLIAPETAPPVTLFASYVDQKNRFELNGVLTPEPELPARFRAWWPFVAWSPEYAALQAGAAVGAELAFIDLPLLARIPFQHARTLDPDQVIEDRHLWANAYFQALRARTGRPSFMGLWEALFEVGAQDTPPAEVMRAVHTFAWCARHAGVDLARREAGLTADGTLAREGHMRWHIDQALKRHPTGRVAVVTGAFHAVALPFMKAQRAKWPADKAAEIRLTPHSYPALSRLYDMARQPGHGAAVWAAMEAGAARPYDAAALDLLVQVVRAARGGDAGASTADGVGAWQQAQNLARLRGNAQVTLDDLRDGVRSALVKGDAREQGGAVARALRDVLTGTAVGRVTAAAGEVPLLASFRDDARRFRLDLSGVQKTVRLDLRRDPRHRDKSAFLHQAAYLQVPLFGELDKHPGRHLRGPDPVRGEDLHLLGETWAVQWSEQVDDRLLSLADRGTSLAAAAGTTLRAALPALREDADGASVALLQAAQMGLNDLFDPVLATVEAAVLADRAFAHLVDALERFAFLLGQRTTLPTHGLARLARVVAQVHDRACRALPTLAGLDPDRLGPTLERLVRLVRLTVDGRVDGLAPEVLLEAAAALAEDGAARPTLRGAAYGVLHGFGQVGEARVAQALAGYLDGGPEAALAAGRFLDGLLTQARGALLRGRRLLAVVDRALGDLDWATFKRALPELRRAFARFTPPELDQLGGRVAQGLGLRAAPALEGPVPAETLSVGLALDRAVAAALAAQGLA